MINLICGDCIEELRKLPEESVNCVITSPPYFGLRDYGVAGQIGLENTIDEYLEKLVKIFQEIRRVLRKDGTVWLNLGDSYAANRTYQVTDQKWKDVGNTKSSKVPTGLKPKDLIGIPWRVAFALQADGWWLRQDIIWHKTNPMPESVRDRCTKAHEYIFLLTKSAKYYYDSEAIKEDAKNWGTRNRQNFKGGTKDPKLKQHGLKGKENEKNPKRNKRTVWTVSTKPYKGAHFATFPPDLIIPCILAGCPKEVCDECGSPYTRTTKTERKNGREKLNCGNMTKDGVTRTTAGLSVPAEYKRKTVTTTGWNPTCTCNARTKPGTTLDPFCGSSTTGEVAITYNRDYIGIELNPDYIELSKKRLANAQPVLFEKN